MQSEPNAHDRQALDDEGLRVILEADDPRALFAASAFADDPKSREAFEHALALSERMDAAGLDLRADRRLAAELEDEHVVGAGLVAGTFASLRKHERRGLRLWRGVAGLAAAGVLVFVLARTAFREPHSPAGPQGLDVFLGATEVPTLRVVPGEEAPVFSWDAVAPPGGWYELRFHTLGDGDGAEGSTDGGSLLLRVEDLEQRTWSPEPSIVVGWPDSFVWSLDVRDAGGGLRASASRTCSLP